MPIRSSITSRPKPPPRDIVIERPDPRCWIGQTVKTPPPGHVLCSDCRGYGRYNYVLNINGSGKHREAICFTCDGDGYRKKDECKHRWRFERKTGETSRVERCTKCKVRRSRDSS